MSQSKNKEWFYCKKYNINRYQLDTVVTHIFEKRKHHKSELLCLYHPDHGGTNDQFALLNELLQVLNRIDKNWKISIKTLNELRYQLQLNETVSGAINKQPNERPKQQLNNNNTSPFSFRFTNSSDPLPSTSFFTSFSTSTFTSSASSMPSSLFSLPSFSFSSQPKLSVSPLSSIKRKSTDDQYNNDDEKTIKPTIKQPKVDPKVDHMSNKKIPKKEKQKDRGKEKDKDIILTSSYIMNRLWLYLDLLSEKKENNFQQQKSNVKLKSLTNNELLSLSKYKRFLYKNSKHGFSKQELENNCKYWAIDILSYILSIVFHIEPKLFYVTKKSQSQSPFPETQSTDWEMIIYQYLCQLNPSIPKNLLLEDAIQFLYKCFL